MARPKHEDIGLGERLDALLRAADMTGVMLAERLGITSPAVTHWRRGHKLPSALHLVALAKLLDTSTDYLLGLAPEPRTVDGYDAIMTGPCVPITGD